MIQKLATPTNAKRLSDLRSMIYDAISINSPAHKQVQGFKDRTILEVQAYFARDEGQLSIRLV